MLETKLYHLFLNKVKEEYKNLLSLFFIIFFLTACLSFFLDKRYTSTISVIPNSADNNVSSIGLLVQDFGMSSSGGNFPIAELSTSNSILDIIYSNTFDLSENKGKTTLADLLGTNKTSFLSKILVSLTKANSNNPDLLKYNTLNKFKSDRLSINYDRKTNITSISVTVEDPLAAQQIAQNFYDELSLFINKSINDGAKIKQAFLNEKIQSVEIELYENENILEDFLNTNKLLNESPRLLKEFNSIQREITLKETAYLLLKRELEIAKIDEVKNTLKLIIIDKPNLPAVKSYPSRLNLSFSIAILLVSIWFLIGIKNDVIRILKPINK